MTDRHVRTRLISPAAAAVTLGVDIATLQRWNILGHGPAAARGLDGAALAYRHSDFEAWRDRLGVSVLDR
jgi:hypothetical protein